MADYIEKAELIKKLCFETAEWYYSPTIKTIKEFPTADVQPISQWISVKDRQPDEDGGYLVCKHNRVRVAEWCKDCWYNESDLPIDDCAITYWQPLPQPPQD